jgi:hypothetical protein
MFLHSVTCLPVKDINKHFIFNLGNTNDIKFSLNNFLNFDLIINYSKSCVFYCANRTILNITFKFIVELNMQLIFDYFYTPRKKRQLRSYFENLICKQTVFQFFNIKTLYINFLFSFFGFFTNFKNFHFIFQFCFYPFVIISWNFVHFFCYVSII